MQKSLSFETSGQLEPGYILHSITIHVISVLLIIHGIKTETHPKFYYEQLLG